MHRFLSVIAIVAVVAVVGGPSALAKKGDKPSGDPTLDAPSGGGQAPRTKGYEKTLNLALKDIENYWSDEFPKLYGKPYKRVSKIIAGEPGVNLPKCNQSDSGEYDEVQGNAFYCFGSNFVAYDDAQLFPQLYHDFGAFSIALVLAHEWGHAIQDRADNQQHPVILQELQADCFAGSWVKRVADGDSAVKLSSGNLDSALSAYLLFRDTPGGSPNDQSAHGAAFDRVSAFQQGEVSGADVCVPYFDPDTQPVIVERPFTDAEDAASGGNIAADKVIPLTVDLLNQFYAAVEPAAYKPLTIDDVSSFDSSKPKSFPKCGGRTPDAKELKDRIFYCTDDNYIAFDESYLQHVYEDIGDFGVATLIANTWATYVQTLQDFPGAAGNDDNAVLGADCYTGGFAAAMFNESLSSAVLADDGTTPETITLSPGDLDETLQSFIDYTAARRRVTGDTRDLDVTFVRLAAFRNGFFNGYEDCAQYKTAGTSLETPSS